MSQRKRSPLAAVLAILAAMMVASCGGCAVVLWLMRPIDEPVTPADRAVMLTVEDVAPYLLEELDGTQATLARFRQPGRVVIKYEYSQPGVLVSTELQSGFGSQNEMRGFTTTFLNLGAGEDHRFSELPGVLAWGDEAKVFLLTRTSTGAKLGNIVVVRKGKRLATYSLVGVYADDAESVNEVFGEKLEALETWTP